MKKRVDGRAICDRRVSTRAKGKAFKSVGEAGYDKKDKEMSWKSLK